jgi:hypothetical protein
MSLLLAVGPFNQEKVSRDCQLQVYSRFGSAFTPDFIEQE